MSYTDQKDFIDVVETPEPAEIQIIDGTIVFPDYEEYMFRAEEIRNALLEMPVSIDTEKKAKKAVAEARKISDRLNAEKIRIKKEILAPYTGFELQVKAIISIISEGEDIARDKLKEIDTGRREEKRKAIEAIWDMRAKRFTAGKYLEFNDFITDKHLNKTTSIENVEKEMVEFLERTSDELEYLEGLPLADLYIPEYKTCFSIPKAMSAVDGKMETARKTADEPYMIVKVTGKADVKLAKNWLEENVNYKIMEEN